MSSNTNSNIEVLMDYSRYWSETQQTINTLDNHRTLRFNNRNIKKIIGFFDIKPNIKLLDSGCGTGVLIKAISEYFHGEIYLAGIDRDVNFIRHAKTKNIINTEFIAGDALKSPFDSNSFDIVLSYTLIEHINTMEFLKEQYRITKSGGIIGVMTCFPPSKIIKVPYFPDEELIYDELYKVINEPEEKRSFDPFLLPEKLEQTGFTGIEIDTISLPIIWDDDSLAHEQKLKIVELKAKEELGYIELIENKLPINKFDNRIEELKSFVKKRYENRVIDIESGKKNWELEMNYTLCIKARKR